MTSRVHGLALSGALAGAAVSAATMPGGDPSPWRVCFDAAVLALGVAGSAVTSGTETAVYGMSRVRVLALAGRGQRRAQVLAEETRDSQRALASLLIANNLFNFLVSFGITGLLSQALGLGPWASVAVQVVLITPLLLIFGETVPKDLARAHADVVVYPAASLLRVFRLVFTWTGLLPLVLFFANTLARRLSIGGVGAPPASTRQRVAALLREGIGHGIFSEQQTGLMDRALALRDFTAADEAVPWRNVVRLNAAWTRGDLEAPHLSLRFDRYPVVDAAGRVVGIATLLEALAGMEATTPHRAVADFARPALFLPPDLTIQGAWAQMQREHQLAAIIGTPERPLGFVTLRDLIEPLVGEFGAG